MSFVFSLIHIQVVDARDRLGGRTHSGPNLEYGGEWIGLSQLCWWLLAAEPEINLLQHLEAPPQPGPPVEDEDAVATEDVNNLLVQRALSAFDSPAQDQRWTEHKLPWLAPEAGQLDRTPWSKLLRECVNGAIVDPARRQTVYSTFSDLYENNNGRHVDEQSSLFNLAQLYIAGHPLTAGVFSRLCQNPVTRNEFLALEAAALLDFFDGAEGYRCSVGNSELATRMANALGEVF